MTVATTAASAQNLGPLEQALERAHYHIYNPPRANWGPGFVFAGDVVNGHIGHVQEVCLNLYRNVDIPNKAKIVLPNNKAESSLSLRIAFNYLKKVLGFANDDADLARIEQQKTADVVWGNVYELSYSDMDKWLESGQRRPVDERCRLAIEDLKAKGQFKGRVFVIVRAVAPDSLRFNFARDFKASVGVSARLAPQIDAGIQGKGEFRDGTSLEINETLFIGYASPMAITDWLPAGEVSGEIVSVRGETSYLTVE